MLRWNSATSNPFLSIAETLHFGRTAERGASDQLMVYLFGRVSSDLYRILFASAIGGLSPGVFGERPLPKT
jgi:hypothetical protein